MRTATVLALALALGLAACATELVCPQGETNCNGRCAALGSDAGNCGSCGHACASTSICAAGSCAACAPDTTRCGDVCAVLAIDPAHCGACGNACGAAQVCTSTGGTTACKSACDGGLTACDRACADLQTSRFHCGACGSACAVGQTCSAGICRADLQVACGATDEVVPLAADLAPAGSGRSVTAGLTALAQLDGAVYTVSGYPVATVDLLSPDLRVAAPLRTVPLAGSDLEAVAVHDGALFVANATANALDVLSLQGTVLDEIPLGNQQAGLNPRSLAFAGSSAYVALGGYDDTTGQAVAVVSLSGLAACTALDPSPPTCGVGAPCAVDRHCVDGVCRPFCGALDHAIDLKGVPGAFDAPGAPFPSRGVAVGAKVYVTLNNLKYSTACGGYSGWCEPAGHGRLAVIDAANADAVSIVDLGPSCGSPGGIAVDGTTLWIACGALSFPTAWPGRVLPVEIGGTPTVGVALDPSPVVPNAIVFCGGVGYLPGMSNGLVGRFDPVTGAFGAPADVCPVGPYGFSYVADLACTP
jgi:hypothetical protein